MEDFPDLFRIFVRGVGVCLVFAISDMLTEEGWDQGYHSEEKREGLKHIFEAALETSA